MITLKRTERVRGMQCLGEAPESTSHGGRWTAISHSALMGAIQDRFIKARREVVDIPFALSPDLLGLSVCFTLDPRRFNPPPNCLPSLGVTLSNDGKKSIEAYCGLVTEEGLGVVIEEVPVLRRHAASLNANNLAADIVEMFLEEAKDYRAYYHHYQRRKLSHPDLCELLVMGVRNKAIPWRELGQIEYSLYPEPFRPEKTRTGWEVLLAHAREVSRLPPLLQLDHLNEFRQLMLSYHP